jgi:hypothetical protein
MKVKKAIRDSLRQYARQHNSENGEISIGSKVLVDLLDDIEGIHDILLFWADVTAAAADEVMTKELRQLAADIAE